MKYIYLILCLLFLLCCSNGTNNQEQSNYIKDLEERIRIQEQNNYIRNLEERLKKLESSSDVRISPGEPGSLEHFIEDTGAVGATIVDGVFMFEGYGYKWDYTKKEYVEVE